MMPANMELTIPAGTTCSSGYSSAASTPPDFNWETFLNELSSLDGPEAADPAEEAFNFNSLSLEPPFNWDNFITANPLQSDATEDVNYFYSLTVQPLGAFITHRTCSFYVAADDPAIQSPNFEHLNFHIVGPSGQKYPVHRLTRLPDGLSCSFLPLEPGFYRLNVFFRKHIHITGSPAQILISRDYETSNQPIISLNIRGDDPKPWGITSNNKTQQLLVADRQKHEILVYGPDGNFNFKFGTPGVAVGEFCRPSGIAYDAVGDRILVTDKDNHRVQIFSSRGEFLSTFGSRGSSDGQFKYPWGIAVSRDGAFIAIADSRNHRIQLFDSEGKYLQQFRRDVKDYPRGITFSLNGDFLYLTDFNLHTVFQVDIKRGSFHQLVGFGELFRPSGLEIDDVGNLIVCSAKDNSIKVFLPNGQLAATRRRIVRASFINGPLDIAITRSGLLAVLEFNGRINIL